MPNHVTHEITFSAEHAERVFSQVCTDGCLDFEKLVPSPPEKYQGGLSGEDEKDFRCNWHTWNREHWGTKWNAYSGSSKVDQDKAVLRFDTAWSIPYPVIAAFCNKFNIPFEHRYYDEGSNYWGIEVWSADRWDKNRVCRTSKRYSNEEDKTALAMQLKGFDPNSTEDQS